MNAPIPCRWTGDSYDPLPRFRRQCNEQMVVGQVYLLDLHEERSSASHRHFFSQLAEIWAGLPEEHDGRWATPEAFRKYLLIKTGHADHRQHVCASKAEALRLRAAIAPMDPYAIVTLTGCIVDVYVAQSMSSRAMNKQAFQLCKNEIFAKLDEMLGVEQGEAERHAGRAA